MAVSMSDTRRLPAQRQIPRISRWDAKPIRNPLNERVARQAVLTAHIVAETWEHAFFGWLRMGVSETVSRALIDTFGFFGAVSATRYVLPALRPSLPPAEA